MADKNFLGLYNRLNSWQSFLAFADTLPNPDTILSSKNETVAMYRPLLTESQIGAAMQARELALKSFEFEWTVDSNAKADNYALDLVKDNFKSENINMAVLQQEMMEAVWLGYAPIETVMMNDGKHIYYERLLGQSAEHFAFDQYNNLVFLSKSRPLDGELVPTSGPEKAVELVAYRATHRNPYGQAQLAGCFWPAHFIKGDMKLWLSYIDRLGDTPIIIKTTSKDAAYRRMLLSTIEDMKSSGGGVVGTDDVLEFLAADKIASSTLFEKFRMINEAAISKIILGHASALDSTPGKLGADQNALVVRGDIVEGDKKFYVHHVNNLGRWLVDRNVTVDVHPVYKAIQEEDVQKDRAERDVTLTNLGVQFEKPYIERTYNLQQDDFKIVEKTNNPLMNDLFSQPAALDPGVKKKDLTPPAELAEEDARPVDGLIESSFKRFEKDFKEYVDAVSIAIKNAEEFEQAIADVIRADNRTEVKSENLELSLLNAQILGIAEIYDSMPESAKEALFAENLADEAEKFMTYPRAKAFLTNKLPYTAEDYNKLTQFQKEFAFTVTGVTKESVSQHILEELTSALSNGYTYKTFREKVKVKDLAGRDLKLAFRQNMNTAYMAGRYDQMKRSADFLPWWEYYTVGDNRVRDEHAVLHGAIRKHDDPFWNIWYPPNGFNCRCGVRALTNEQVEAMGIETDSGIPTYEDLAKDEKLIDINISGAHQAKDKFLPAEGFRHNPAKVRTAWLEYRVKEDIATGIQRKNRYMITKENWETKDLKPFKKMQYDQKMQLTNISKEDLIVLLEKKIPAFPGTEIRFIKDVSGKQIVLKINKLVRHISKEFNNRYSYGTVIDDVIKNPDEVWDNIQLKQGEGIVRIRNYFKMINGKSIHVVATGKGGVFEITTMFDRTYPDNERYGVLAKK